MVLIIKLIIQLEIGYSYENNYLEKFLLQFEFIWKKYEKIYFDIASYLLYQLVF